MFAKDDYLGKKNGSGIPQFIISKMPKHDVYIEAFLGTGVIMAKKEKAKVNIGIDKDLSILQKSNFTDEYQILHGNSSIFLRSLIEKYNYDGSKIVVYLDPPYLPETRSSFSSCQYRHEFCKDSHIQLLDIIHDLSMKYSNVYFMISGYASQLYKTMLEHRGWYLFSMQTMSRGGARIESLWTNFNPDEYIKHDYNYTGHNFTDRQRIKRKAQRWVNNLNDMPLDERYHIVKEILHSQKELLELLEPKSNLTIQDHNYGGLKSFATIGDDND